jgi:hypothetical protein
LNIFQICDFLISLTLFKSYKKRNGKEKRGLKKEENPAPLNWAGMYRNSCSCAVQYVSTWSAYRNAESYSSRAGDGYKPSRGGEFGPQPINRQGAVGLGFFRVLLSFLSCFSWVLVFFDFSLIFSIFYFYFFLFFEQIFKVKQISK